MVLDRDSRGGVAQDRGSATARVGGPSKTRSSPEGKPGRCRVDHRGGNPRVAAVVRRVQRFRLRHRAETRLWLLPLTCVLAGIGLAVALLSVDRSIVGTAVTGSAASVQTILTRAPSALGTPTSGVLSLTPFAGPLAVGAFSPRLLRGVLPHPPS